MNHALIKFLAELDNMIDLTHTPSVWLVFQRGQVLAQVSSPGALAAVFRLLNCEGDESISYEACKPEKANQVAYAAACNYAINDPGFRRAVTEGLIYRGPIARIEHGH